MIKIITKYMLRGRKRKYKRNVKSKYYYKNITKDLHPLEQDKYKPTKFKHYFDRLKHDVFYDMNSQTEEKLYYLIKKIYKLQYSKMIMNDSEVLKPFIVDIFIPSKKLIIEYNGQQHYYFNKYYHQDSEDLMKQQRRDEIKKTQALEKGFNFVIFKYNEKLDEISIKKKLDKFMFYIP